MDKEAIKTHLTRAEFGGVQADALADILADMATKSDLRDLRSELKLDLQDFKRELDGRLATFQREVDGRLATFQRDMEARFHDFQRELDGRLNSFQSSVSRQLSTMDTKIDGFDTKLERHIRNAVVVITGITGLMIATAGLVVALAG